MLLCHSLCYNEKYWLLQPYWCTERSTSYHFMTEKTSIDRVMTWKFSKTFQTTSESQNRKTIPRHSDILDILIVAYIIYKIIFWIKETRAWVLFKGILVIFALAADCHALKAEYDSLVLSNTILSASLRLRCIPAGAAKGTGAAGQRKILHRLRQKLWRNRW